MCPPLSTPSPTWHLAKDQSRSAAWFWINTRQGHQADGLGWLSLHHMSQLRTRVNGRGRTLPPSKGLQAFPGRSRVWGLEAVTGEVGAGLGYKTGNLARVASGKQHLVSESLIYRRLTVLDFPNMLGSWLGWPHTNLGSFIYGFQRQEGEMTQVGLVSQNKLNRPLWV